MKLFVKDPSGNVGLSLEEFVSVAQVVGQSSNDREASGWPSDLNSSWSVHDKVSKTLLQWWAIVCLVSISV